MEISAGDARLHMRDILNAVDRGEQVVITRYATPAAVVVRVPVTSGPVVTEYGQEHKSGDYLLWEADSNYPAEKRLANAQRTGGKVRRRRVIVVEEWTEIRETGS